MMTLVGLWLRLDYTACICDWICKKGLPHTSDLQASTIHKFGLLKGMDPQILQFRVLTWHKMWCKFQVSILLEHQVMVLKSQKIGCVWKTPFCKFSHI